MLKIELWISKNRWKLAIALILIIVLAINPYAIYKKNKTKSLNQKRIVVEREFSKDIKQRDNDLLAKGLKHIERENKKLFMTILISNSLKTNEYKSLVEQKDIYKQIESESIKTIVDLEMAIEEEDLGKLKDIYGRVEEPGLKGYILYIIKAIDPKTDIEFKEDSVLKGLYIG